MFWNYNQEKKIIMRKESHLRLDTCGNNKKIVVCSEEVSFVIGKKKQKQTPKDKKEIVEI